MRAIVAVTLACALATAGCSGSSSMPGNSMMSSTAPTPTTGTAVTGPGLNSVRFDGHDDGRRHVRVDDGQHDEGYLQRSRQRHIRSGRLDDAHLRWSDVRACFATA